MTDDGPTARIKRRDAKVCGPECAKLRRQKERAGRHANGHAKPNGHYHEYDSRPAAQV